MELFGLIMTAATSCPLSRCVLGHGVYTSKCGECASGPKDLAPRTFYFHMPTFDSPCRFSISEKGKNHTKATYDISRQKNSARLVDPTNERETKRKSKVKKHSVNISLAPRTIRPDLLR
jgi:hypothetical protein